MLQPDQITPRLISKSEAAKYLGYADAKSVEKLVSAGVIPAAIPGTSRYDRLAIDAALDKLAGLRQPKSGA
jgi:hypothetical protein